LPLIPGETAFIFLIEKDVLVDEKIITEKTAALLNAIATIKVEALKDQTARFFFFSAKPLKEPIAWGGPIVMNTKEELNQAFWELREGTFIK